MLIDEPRVLRGDDDPMIRIVMNVISDGKSAEHIDTGVYTLGHFGHSNFLRPGYYESWNAPDILDKDGNEFGNYGVCDAVQQIFDRCTVIRGSVNRQFVITLTPIFRGEQPLHGGWRWHKWGPYIGVYEPQCEYLHDEPEIDMVMVFHIYEKED